MYNAGRRLSKGPRMGNTEGGLSTEAAHSPTGSTSQATAGVTVSLRKRRDKPMQAFGFHRHATVSYNTTLEVMMKAKKDDEAHHAETATTRDLIFYLMDGFPNAMTAAIYPKWMQASVWMERVNIAFILLSVASIATETLPQYFSQNYRAFFIIEILCIAFFTVDFVIRIACVRDRAAFIRKIRNIIDIVSILPFYVALFVTGETSTLMLRMLRMIRILRVLKLSRNNVGLMAVTEAVRESSEAITMLFFLLIVALVLFSSLMFYAEQTGSSLDAKTQQWMRDDGTVSPFQSIFHTMWWCIVTMTTVGYGDDVPVTPLGKIVGSATMLCGVFVLAFPTVILSTNFQEIHQAKVEGFQELQAYAEAQDKAAKRRQEQLRQRQEEEERAKNTRKSIAELVSLLSRQRSQPNLLSHNSGLQLVPSTSSAGTAAPEGPRSSTPQNLPAPDDADRLSPGQAELPTTIPFLFDPYSKESLRRQFNDSSMQRRKSQDEEGGTPSLTARDEYGNENLADPSIKRELVIVSDKVAVYNPVLFLRCSSNRHIRAKAETFVNKAIVTLQLCIESEGCQEAAEDALHLFRPDIASGATVMPRPICKMKVHMECEHPSLRSVRLLCETFISPLGIVPLSLVVPSRDLVTVLMSNLGCISIATWVQYDAPSRVEEPLLHYGGMMLAGTGFDDDEQLAHELRLVDDYNNSSFQSEEGALAVGTPGVPPEARTGSRQGGLGTAKPNLRRLGDLLRRHVAIEKAEQHKGQPGSSLESSLREPPIGAPSSENRPGSQAARRSTATFSNLGPA
jgi:hypothetical protein